MQYRWFMNLPLLASIPPAHAGPTCNVFNFTVDITAPNLQLPTNLTALTSPSAISYLTSSLLETLPSIEIQGTYTISARYCEPEVYNASRHDTVQLLIHGVVNSKCSCICRCDEADVFKTYDKNYWSGLGPPGYGYDGNKYSYIEYASQQGFPTVAIDRICNGNSSHPNGLTVCQLPANAESFYQIVQQLRTTTIAGGRTFENVILVCHSEGSTACQYLMQLHPDAPIATYVLHAFTNEFLVGGPAVVVVANLLPAAIAAPDRFPGLDPTYLLVTSAQGALNIFYHGDYDPALAAYDFATTKPIPVGEFATSSLSQLPAPLYKGSVFVLNGQQDMIFCAVLPTDPLTGQGADCGTGATSKTALTKSNMPNAQYHWNQVADTGHDLNLHLTAPTSWELTNEYLVSQGL